jgi:hypothetical protein
MYAGDSSLPFGNKLDIAVPLSQLWELSCQTRRHGTK